MTRADARLSAKEPLVCSYGAEVILRYVDTLGPLIAGARTMEDPEDVHQLRVASRRLRAALPVFKECFPKRDYSRWRRDLKGLTGSLGLARDADVQIMFLDQLVKGPEGKGMKLGLEFLLHARREHRTILQGDVMEALRSLVSGGTVDELEDACRLRFARSGGRQEPHLSPIVLSTAQRSIRKALSRLLALSDFADDQDAHGKHHEMRIASKRLRYTLEIFSSLYRGRLTREIRAFKRLQDLLGEMHDCDVWMDFVPAFVEGRGTELEKEPQAGRDLDTFLSFISRRRERLYREFHRFWRGRRMMEVLSSIGDKASRVLHLPASSFRKIAVISDIHGNLDAFNAVLKDAKRRGVRLFLCAGDLVGFGPFPDEAVKAIMGSRSITIAGNFDDEVLSLGKVVSWKSEKDLKAISLRFAAVMLSERSRYFLSSLPRTFKVRIGDRTILMVHGSPRSDEEKVTETTDESLLNSFLSEGSADVLVCGHSHIGFIRQVEKGLVLNPGSVGRPGDGDPRASYAMVRTRPFAAEIVRVHYDTEATADSLRRLGLPEMFARQFLTGRSLEGLMEAEKDYPSMEGEERVKRCRDLSLKLIGLDPHTECVVSHSLRLFDLLSHIHRMGSQERFLLECAALLHDIGWSEDGAGHHKRSMRMVLNDTSLPLTTDERRMVASIVRYHNSLPKKGHASRDGVGQTDRRAVIYLSSLLRMADSLDASHESIVRTIDTRTEPGRVVLMCVASGDPTEERRSFAAKKDLFQKAFRKKVWVEWSPVHPC